jgi:hypothetical protein
MIWNQTPRCRNRGSCFFPALLNRDDPFAFVSRATAPRDVGVVRPPTVDKIAVQILGFAHVDRASLLLQIDGGNAHDEGG